MKQDKVSWKSPEGMTQDLFKIFEKYRIGAMLCFWANLTWAIKNNQSKRQENSERLHLLY